MRLPSVLKKIVIGSFLFLIILLLVFVFLYWKTDIVSNGIKNYLDSTFKGKAKIEYQTLYGTLLNSVKIKKLAIKTSTGVELKVNYLELRYRLFPLLSNKIEISRVILDRVQIILPKQESSSSGPPVSADSLLNYLQSHYLPQQLLGDLPDIDLRNLEITSSEIRIRGEPLTFTDIQLRVSRLRLKPNAIFLMLTNLSGKWQEQQLLLKSLSFVLKGDQHGINLNQGELHTARSELLFNALLEPNSGLNFNLTYFSLDLSELRRQASLPYFRQGKISGTLSLSGVPVHFGLEGKIKGAIDQRKISQLDFALRYDRGEIFLDRLQLNSNFGQIKANGYWNQEKRIIGRLSVNALNLFTIMPELPSTHINGQLTLNASNLRLSRLTGHGALTLNQSMIDSIRIDSVHFRIKARRGFLTISEPSFIKIADSSKFFLSGTLDRKHHIDFSLLTFNNSLPRLLRDVGGDSLRGHFDGRIRLFGPLRNPNLSGNIFCPHFTGYGVRLDSTKFTLYVEGLAKERFGNGDFRIASGRIGNFPLDRVSFHLYSEKQHVELRNLRFISGKNYFDTSVRIHWAIDSLNVAFFPWKIQYQKYWAAAKDTLEITVNAQEAVLENWEFYGPQNSRLNLNGFFDFTSGDFQTFVSLENVRIAPIERLAGSNLTLDGITNGYAEILTPLTDPNIEVDLKVDSLSLKHVLLGRLASKFRYADESLSIDSLSLSNGPALIAANGSFALHIGEKKLNLLQNTTANLEFKWNNISLKPYKELFDGLHRLQGTTSGRVRVTGAVEHPKIWSRMVLDRFRVDEFSGDSLRAQLHYSDGYVHLDSFTVVLDSSTFHATGWQKFDLNLANMQDDILQEPFRLHVWSHDDQLMFLGNLNETVESIQGPYNIDLLLTGTPAKPAVQEGTISLTDGQILLSMIRDPIKNVQFEATIQNSLLKIKHCRAYSRAEKDIWQKMWSFISSLLPWGKHSAKEGSLIASGQIDLSDLYRPKIDLRVKLDQFYVDYFIQNFSLIVSSDNLTIQGQDTILVQGDLYVPKGVFEVDLAQLSRNVYLTEETVKPIPPYLSLNLRIEIPDNFTVTSSPLDLTNNFRITFMGDLVVTMEPPSEEPRIQGHLEATNGKYASWNQNFIVEEATIDFKNKMPPNPDINFKAFKVIRNKTFELSITGNLEELNQNIRVLENGQELNLSYFDKIALLTLGTDISTLQSNVDSTLRNVGESIATTSILTAVERGAERFMGLDKVEISANRSLIDLNRFRLNNGLSDASIAFGKYLTSDLYVEYRTQFGSNIPAPRLSWDAGNRVGLQYRINRHWTLDSYYEITQKGNTRIKFGLSWEYAF